MAILRVIQAFSVLSDPTGHVYTPGELVDSEHPHVKVGGPGKFETVEAHVQRRSVVEQATAEPGRRRTRSKPSKAPAAVEPVEAAEPAAEEGDES